MCMGIEALFSSALGLQAPWSVEKVELDTARQRIDFELTCKANRLPCPHCQAIGQSVHDRLQRQWRHLDFFQYEAWLHAPVPRIACTACGKTTQMDVPWAREGSGFTALFEALALSLCQTLPVRQAAALLRCCAARTNNCGGASGTCNVPSTQHCAMSFSKLHRILAIIAPEYFAVFI